jgi:hypothetical protein
MPSTLKILPVAFALGMSPAVYAELESITDGELSSVTGQSGITIDYSGSMSMQEFRYEDAGEYVAQDIRSGGAGVTSAGAAAGYGDQFDDARLTLDIASDGGLDLVWQSRSGAPIDWGMAVDLVAFGDGQSSARSDVYSNIQTWGQLLAAQYSIVPAAETGLGRSAIFNYAAYTVENLSASKADSTIGIEGGYVKSPDYMGNSLDDMDLTDQIPAWAEGQRGRSATPMDDIRAGFSATQFTVYRGVDAGQSGSADDTITIGVNGFAADIGAQNMSVGQADLGRMTLDNVQVSDTIITLTP